MADTVNDINGISVSMTLAEAAELSLTVKALQHQLDAAKLDIERERQDFEAYRSAEDERERNRRMRDEETLAQRVAVLEKNERRQAAQSDWLNAKSIYLSKVWATVEKRLTKTERERMNAEKRRVDEAWERFDKVPEGGNINEGVGGELEETK